MAYITAGKSNIAIEYIDKILKISTPLPFLHEANLKPIPQAVGILEFTFDRVVNTFGKKLNDFYLKLGEKILLKTERQSISTF